MFDWAEAEPQWFKSIHPLWRAASVFLPDQLKPSSDAGAPPPSASLTFALANAPPVLPAPPSDLIQLLCFAGAE